jgi:hypothetical protein
MIMQGLLKRLSMRSVVVAAAVCALVIATLVAPLDRATVLVNLAIGLAWPLTILLALIFFWPQVQAILNQVVIAVAGGRGFKIVGVFELSEAAGRIPSPPGNEPVTFENIALLHTSFLRQDKTQEFADGRSYYQFEVIVMAPSHVMDRIKSVEYHLEAAWKDRRTQVISDKSTRFKMKELANGTSIVTADIHFNDSAPKLTVNRFIDLRPDGPRL